MIKSVFKIPGSDTPVQVRLERRSAGGDDSFLLENDAGERIEFELLSDAPTEGQMLIHGRVHRFYTCRRDGRIDVWLDGRIYSVEPVDATARRAGDSGSAGPAASAISAPMPGTILKINTKPGDTIAAHDALVVMESMKMEMTLSAPRAGRVKDVHCAVGELVEMGRVLVTLEPSGDA